MEENISIDIDSISKDKIKDYTFIDIREDMERMIEPVEEVESEHIPLSEYQISGYEFDPSKKYLIFCAKGMRSYGLTEQLREQGVQNTFSINDGTDAIKSYFKKGS